MQVGPAENGSDHGMINTTKQGRNSMDTVVTLEYCGWPQYHGPLRVWDPEVVSCSMARTQVSYLWIIIAEAANRGNTVHQAGAVEQSDLALWRKHLVCSTTQFFVPRPCLKPPILLTDGAPAHAQRKHDKHCMRGCITPTTPQTHRCAG